MVHNAHHQLIVDTIVAQATPAGYGGIAVVRVSGPLVTQIAGKVLGEIPQPWRAKIYNFTNQQQELIDYGFALYFPQPNSFTGEDVLELHCHGSPIVVQLLQQVIVAAGARYARPGEFSERAFINGKIDLSQAEAIADLIHASSAQAARSALRSVQGEFSHQVNSLVEEVIQVRMYIEAALDFVEEEIDFLNNASLLTRLRAVEHQLTTLLNLARQGSILRDGINIAIIGPTNVGKSTLINALSGTDVAIVTDIPGTTRDLLQQQLNIDGLALHIVDTAGLRETTDLVEQEGIKRAQEAMYLADLILHVVAAGMVVTPLPGDIQVPVILVNNKIDLLNLMPRKYNLAGNLAVDICAKTHAGINLLTAAIKEAVGYHAEHVGCFSARQRHVAALTRAKEHIVLAIEYLITYQAGSELIAEELRQVQLQLNSITGEFTNEDLLTRIFASFCIGK